MRGIRLSILVFGCVLISPTICLADAIMTQGAQRLAGAIASFLESEELPMSVMMGDFKSAKELQASGGAGIGNQIAQSLAKHKVKVEPTAGIQIEGSFNIEPRKEFEGAEFNSVALRIRSEIKDQQGESLQIFNISVFGSSALQIAGGTADLPANASSEQVEDIKLESFVNPEAAILENEVRATPVSEYGVEVVLSTGTPCTPEIHDGRAFINLKRDDEYVIRLHNDSKFDAAVELTVDGLDVFVLSQDVSFAQRIIVPAGKFVSIPGWYVNKDLSRAFVITSLPEGLAAKRQTPSESIGTITASFAAAWDPAGAPPEDEVGTKGADLSTGVGREINKQFVQVKRAIGRVRSVVSVRYNR